MRVCTVESSWSLPAIFSRMKTIILGLPTCWSSVVTAPQVSSMPWTDTTAEILTSHVPSGSWLLDSICRLWTNPAARARMVSRTSAKSLVCDCELMNVPAPLSMAFRIASRRASSSVTPPPVTVTSTRFLLLPLGLAFCAHAGDAATARQTAMASARRALVISYSR